MKQGGKGAESLLPAPLAFAIPHPTPSSRAIRVAGTRAAILTSARRAFSAHAAERAAIMLSLVAGVQMMRQMIGLSALADADPETFIDLLAPLFQKIVTGKGDLAC